MIPITLAFLSGILLVQQLAHLPTMPWLILCAIGAGLMAYWRQRIMVTLCLGVLWAALFASLQLADRLPAAMAGDVVTVTGRIADLPEISDNSTRFALNVTEAAPAIPSKLRLSWYFAGDLDKAKATAIKAGQLWTLAVKLKPPHGQLNPGGFDYERWLLSAGIGATGTVRPYPAPVLRQPAPLWMPIAVWRQSINDRLSRLDIQAESIALLKALTIGYGNDLQQAQWDIFRQTGTTHLVVISGSHIGLIAGFVYFLVARCWAWTGYLAWSPQRVAAVAALVAGIFYAGMAGFSVPTQRAVVMLAVVMLAIIWQRHVQPFHTLALALLAVLLYDPLAVLLPGFWLSFAAVAVIAYAVSGRLGKPHYLLEALKINWVTSLGLAPLLLFFFQQVSLCAPLANLFAVPVISFVLVPLALAATLLLYVYPPLATILMLGLDKLLQGLMWVLGWFAQWPLAILDHPQPTWWALLLACLGLLWLFAPRGLPARYLGVALLLPLLFPTGQALPTGTLRLTLLDVGQGLAVVVQTANHWLVYDTGPKFSPESDSGQHVLLPFLRSLGAAHLDTVMISHGDRDHIGGADSLLKGIPTARVLTSVPEQLPDHAPEKCVAGQTWDWDGVTFTVLSPPPIAFASDNNNSCVLKIASAEGSALLTGDIEAETENWLVQTYGGQLQADVLVAPHHGSKTSSTLAFLRTVSPQTVLIPAGFHNPFGHPHASILRRYEAINAHWLNTADSGAITLNFQNGGRALAWFRQTEARYWHYR